MSFALVALEEITVSAVAEFRDAADSNCADGAVASQLGIVVEIEAPGATASLPDSKATDGEETLS